MRYFFLLIIVLFSLRGLPQKQRFKIDSLLQLLKVSGEDTNRINLYSNIASYYYGYKPDSFFIYCKKGLDLAASLNHKPSIAILNLKMSAMLSDTGNYTLAMKCAETSLKIAQELNSKALLSQSYNAMGQVYDFQADFVKSSDYFFKAMKIAEELNDHTKIAMIGTNLAAAYFNEGNSTKAEEYSFITLKEAQIANSPINIYKAYDFIGIIKQNNGDSVAAAAYYEKAIEICKANSFVTNEAEVMTDLASVQKNDAKKLNLLLQARKVYDSIASPSLFESRINWLTLGETYMGMFKANPVKKDLLQQAEKYFLLFEKKSKDANDILSVAQGLSNLSKVNELKGNYRRAYELSKQYHAINDSMFSQDNKNKIAGIQSRNEIEKKNLEIEQQRLQVKEQRKNAFFLLTGLLLVAAIGFLFFRLSSIRNQKNKLLTKLNQELDEANKLKSKFFGILSHDLRSPISNLINFLTLQKIKPGALSKEQSEERENKISHSAQSLLETMESMLLWSKSQMQHFKPEKKLVNVHHLFSYIHKRFEDYDNILFHFLNDENLDIETDENYLHTIMYNLTSNAVKASANIPEALIEWKAWSHQSNIYFSITDNGHGIAQDQFKALYDETTDAGIKHGFGFHIIRDLAKAINCSVSLKPGTGNGTTVILCI